MKYIKRNWRQVIPYRNPFI